MCQCRVRGGGWGGSFLAYRPEDLNSSVLQIFAQVLGVQVWVEGAGFEGGVSEAGDGPESDFPTGQVGQVRGAAQGDDFGEKSAEDVRSDATLGGDDGRDEGGVAGMAGHGVPPGAFQGAPSGVFLDIGCGGHGSVGASGCPMGDLTWGFYNGACRAPVSLLSPPWRSFVR